MLSIWLRFKRWWRSLLIAVATHTHIDWVAKVNELVAIINSALDRKSPSPEPTPGPTPEPLPERTRRRWFRWRRKAALAEKTATARTK
jgi:hypothetical protein